MFYVKVHAKNPEHLQLKAIKKLKDLKNWKFHTDY